MLKPINGNVIVKKNDDDSISNGFVMTTEGDSKFTKGVVVASDCESIKEGMVVIFAKFAVDKVDNMFVIHNSDIFAIDE